MSLSMERTVISRGWLAPAVLGAAAALGAVALYTSRKTHEAEQKYPPIGRFLSVDGVRLHYIERGTGEPLVLIHGNGTLIQDFTISGIVDRLSERYRVIVFDRPGYGYSTRPRRLWTPRAHATLFQEALQQLDVAQNLPLAIPGIGDVMRHTVSPLLARLMLPLAFRKMFEPAPVPEYFDRLFPKELMLRPIQLRASNEDAALMTPAVMELEQHYGELTVPVVIVTGGDDKIANVGRQSQRLHQELAGSEFILVPGAGHMIHHLAPDQVVAAIDRVAQLAAAVPTAA